ncbi:potassium-transporting ATPase subunit KdpA, partial [Staphylococcus aureus]
IRAVRVHIKHIAKGPLATLELIKHPGTIGRGLLEGNSATPIENPTNWSIFIAIGSMKLLPTTKMFLSGRMISR